VLPGDVLPGDVLPGDLLPGDVLPGYVLPGYVLPGDVLPGDLLPGDLLPGNFIFLEGLDSILIQVYSSTIIYYSHFMLNEIIKCSYHAHYSNKLQLHLQKYTNLAIHCTMNYMKY
jgi:hypothetical protein